MADPVRELIDLLNVERAALVRADFLTVAKNAAQKESLLSGLHGATVPAPRLQKLRSALEQNQVLFTAAVAGINAAKNRIQTLNDVRSGLRTYDQAGQISRVEGQISGVNKCS